MIMSRSLALIPAASRAFWPATRARSRVRVPGSAMWRLRDALRSLIHLCARLAPSPRSPLERRPPAAGPPLQRRYIWRHAYALAVGRGPAEEPRRQPWALLAARTPGVGDGEPLACRLAGEGEAELLLASALSPEWQTLAGVF